GGWLKNFDPFEVNNNYTEANGWQYTFYTPQNLSMINQDQLSKIFKVDNHTKGRTQSDITGLMGQYAHGNEPSHHIAFLPGILGNQKMTDSLVTYILTHFYTNAPDGLIGNEDCGQMSAWYIWASLGKYPVCPGDNKYASCQPIYHLNQFDTLQKYGIINSKEIGKYTMPVCFENNTETFHDSLIISIKNYSKVRDIYCRVKSRNWKKPGPFSYDKPFTIYEDTKISLFKYPKSNPNAIAYFHKIPNNWIIKLINKPNNQYTAGGAEAMIDGLRGDKDWRKGRWQGYQYKDFECVIDLKGLKEVSEVSLGCLQDSRSWILMPKQILAEYSIDGKEFFPLGSITTNISDSAEEVVIKDWVVKHSPVKAAYIKVRAVNFGKLPDWHLGKGDEAFIFVDEVTVK
ncbi:MAG: glycoside hydrolase family 92 protein, partial [Bacteroidetes bacterium]|nr:glycoside hydrolase family 92 protein [Bacteroidota bacterium]